MKVTYLLSNRVVRKLLIILVAVWLPATVIAANTSESGNFASGAKSWANNCSRCHNMRDPSDLRDDQWTTAVFHMRVRAGLTGQQTRDILAFLQGSNNVAVAESIVLMADASGSGSSLSGEEIYNQSCVACHGGNGKGTVPGAPDFTLQDGVLSQSDSVLMQHILNGFQSPGSPMAMPPKGGNAALTQDDISAVLEHLKEQFGN